MKSNVSRVAFPDFLGVAFSDCANSKAAGTHSVPSGLSPLKMRYDAMASS
nr:MAG: hypothetical protein [Bacteriophage sp.]